MSTPHAHHTPSIGPVAIDCALVHAGEKSMLLIEERAGRLPLRSVQAGGMSWVCADGRQEHLAVRRSKDSYALADIRKITDLAASKGLLIAEIPATDNPLAIEPAFVKHWMLHAPSPTDKESGAHYLQREVHNFGENIRHFGAVAGQSVSSSQYSFENMQQFRRAMAETRPRLNIYDAQGSHEPSHHSRANVGALQMFGKFARSAVLFVTVALMAYGAKNPMFSEHLKPAQDIKPAPSISSGIVIQQEAARPTLQPSQEEQSAQELSPTEKSMLEVRHKLNFVETQYQGRQVMVLDYPSRILLTKEAARVADLDDVGLNWKDLYGVIHAETAWVSRDGIGKNRVISQGLAQMEPATAKGYGIQDPNDEVDAIFGAARLVKEAAQWSKARVARLRLPTKEAFQKKVREGVSIYYNTSTALRRTWDGLNTHEMPIETNHHIRNMRDGAFYAGQIERKMEKANLIQKLNEQPQTTDEEVSRPRNRYASVY